MTLRTAPGSQRPSGAFFFLGAGADSAAAVRRARLSQNTRRRISARGAQRVVPSGGVAPRLCQCFGHDAVLSGFCLNLPSPSCPNARAAPPAFQAAKPLSRFHACAGPCPYFCNERGGIGGLQGRLAFLTDGRCRKKSFWSLGANRRGASARGMCAPLHHTLYAPFLCVGGRGVEGGCGYARFLAGG